jgi:hypothetical protein
MLPGFRFLFTAIVLTMSILIFGLGAAALLRAAHEEFASVPSWHTAPETMFAQPNEALPPVLAMLRIEPRIEEQKAPDDIPATTSPTEPSADASNPDQPTGGTDTAETELAANEAVVPATEQTVVLVSSNNDKANPTIAPTKIATLSDPTVLIDTPQPAKASVAKIDKAKSDQQAIKKRLLAREAAQRRRNALRARLAQQQQLQQANPFAQPDTQPTVRPVTTTPRR